jgi:hypothetical protein
MAREGPGAAQARRDADDKRTADIALDRQKRLEADAAKTRRLREQRLAKEAADKITADEIVVPESSAKRRKKLK